MEEKFNLDKKAILLGVGGVLGVIILFNSFTIVESGKVGIKITLGKYDNEELPAGFHTKIPFVQEIREADVRVRTVNHPA